METSFPRGSASASRSTTTSAVGSETVVVAAADKANNKKNSSSSSISTTKKKKRSADVLFGAALPTDSVDEKKKTKHSSSKRKKKDSDTVVASSSSHTSLMPLGGGGVVLSTSSSSSSKAATDATTTTAFASSSSSSSLSSSLYYPGGYIESLSFGKLHSGVALWAVVREVHDDLAVFSLPHQWTAYMLRGQEGVDALSSAGGIKGGERGGGTPCNVMLQKGQMLAVKILQAVQESSSSNKKGGASSAGGPKRRIQVTCLPHKINPTTTLLTAQPHSVVRGQVMSIEDFGLLIDLGYTRRGFLPFDEIDGDYYCTLEEKEELNEKNGGNSNSNSSNVAAAAHCLLEGRIMDFVVRKTSLSSSSTTTTTTTGSTTDSGAVVPLRLPRPQDMIAEYFLPGSRPTDIISGNNNKQNNAAALLLPSLQELQPGALVRARVEAMVRNGLCVSFGGSHNSVYRGAIEVQHLGGFWIPKSRVGSSSSSHGHAADQDDWKSIFDVYRNVTARIIAIDARTKLIRLTLLPHLLQGNCRSLQNGNNNCEVTTATTTTTTTTGPPLLPEVGTIVEGATVVRLDPGIGALLALPPAPVAVSDDEHEPMQVVDNDDDDDDDKESKRKKKNDKDGGPLSVLRQSFWESESYQKASKVQAVYVHISKAMDGVANSDDNKASRVKTPETVFSKEFAPSTKHTVRILSTANLMEGIPAGATAKSIVQAHVLTHADLKPGQVYKQVPVCAQMEGGSIMVHFGMGVKGLIPAMHLFDHAQQQFASDYRSKIRKIKYAVNAKVDVRVLHVNAERKECIVTAKKALVKAPHDEILVAFQDAKVGMNVTGFVSRILDHGLAVTCFNRVHGRVTVRSLRNELGIDNHKENFSIGDVVQCRIVNIRRRKRHYGRRHNADDDNDDDHDDVNDDDDHENDNDNIDAAAADAIEHGNHRTYWELTLNVRKHQSEQDGGDENEDEELEHQVDELAEERVQITAGSILPAGSLRVTELVKGKAKAKGFVPGYAVVAVKSKQLAANGYDTTGMVKVIECKLPFDQLVDEYKSEHLTSAEALDDFAASILKKVGKKINKKAMVLEDPKKSRSEFLSGTGHFVILTLRPKLIELAEAQAAITDASSVPRGSSNPLLPGPDTHLYKGANLLGYVGNLDPRHGGFVRFLDGFAGLMPKKEGGLDLPLYSTINTTIMAIDVTTTPPKIVLTQDKRGKTKIRPGLPPRGHRVQNVEIKHVGFNSATVKILDPDFPGNQKVQARVHCALATSEVLKGPLPLSNKTAAQKEIPKCHPFYKWREGMTLSNLVVVGVSTTRDGNPVIDLSTIFTKNEEEEGNGNVGEHEENGNAKASLKDTVDSSKDNDDDASANNDSDKMITEDEKKSPFPLYYQKSSEIKKGSRVSGIVASVSPHNGGLWILLTPHVSAFLPALEASQDINVLHNLGRCFPKGSRLECVVIDKATVSSKLHRRKAGVADAGDDNAHKQVVHVSLLGDQADKPQVAALVVGRVNRHLRPTDPPALMVDLRGGYTGRCCITELAEADDWTNMPVGKEKHDSNEMHHGNDEEKDMSTETTLAETNSDDKFAHGSIVMCRVLATVPKKPIVDISCRESRIEGDLEDDEPPQVGDTMQAYVKSTTKKGCFVRLSRQIDGRVLIKELSDGFVPDPVASFPQGRLVIGKVKSIQEIEASKRKTCCKFKVEFDMRESTLLDAQAKIKFQEIQVGSKHKGTVTRVEDYGVFVQLQNSEITGLTHKSECSDKYIKKLQDLYDPGDMVKVLVLKKDEDKKQIGFSMKASHFADDESSDDSSIDENVSDSDEEEEEEGGGEPEKGGAVACDDELDSEDENFVSKLAAKQAKEEQDDPDEEMEDAESKESEEESDDESDDDDDDDDVDVDQDNHGNKGMDTNVGFDWDVTGLEAHDKSGATSDGDDEDSSSDESEDSEDGVQKSSHKSRKKQAQKRREEQEIARRETALADGTADENPETASDFERLLASSPNSSELWIRYMAFHLTLADISAARQVAERALQRIEFRLEREKLNVWCALLTLEHKYGNEKSLKQAMDRACAQVNPKHVHLRVCEIMEKEANMAPGPGVQERTDDMYSKMCKKFKSKKKVWLAHAEYLLKMKRHDEALALSKRALLSLAVYKHVEMMSKFAQLVFEYGSAEQARTLFDGLLAKCPKRLDLLFVYADKEIKHGDVEMARSLFASVTAAATSTAKDKGASSSSSSSARKMKLSDKQMKNLFKRWYGFEEKHGTDESREKVKDAARAYVEGS